MLTRMMVCFDGTRVMTWRADGMLTGNGDGHAMMMIGLGDGRFCT